jgi:deoxyribodipyrimidine photo-lyase
MPEYSRALVWFRRDLRDFDHAALYHALKSARQVVCVFVFDREIFDALPNRADRRVEFIHASVTQLQQALQARGGGLVVVHDHGRTAIPRLAAELDVEAVYCNHDDDPAAIARDAAVEAALSAEGIAFHHGKDCTIFERDEVLTAAGTPFSVFTPYKNAWLKKLAPFYLTAYPVERYWGRLAAESTRVPALAAMGFTHTNLTALKLPVGMSGGAQLFADFLDRIGQYKDARDFPAIKGPSYLSVHLRFGTVSVRQLAATACGLGGAGRKPGCRNSSGVISITRFSGIAPKWRPDRPSSRNSTPCPGPTHPGISKPGAKRAPAIRWSTRQCGN